MGTPFSASNENIAEDYRGFKDDTRGEKLVFDLHIIEQQFNDRLKVSEEENNQLVQQINLLKQRLRSQEEQFSKTVEEIKETFSQKLSKCTKDRDAARKDLESMVVKYAKSEKDVISVKKCKDDAERRVRDLTKDKESLQSRVKSLSCDKASLIKSLDQKVSETLLLQRENEKLKEELKDKESKWRSAQQSFVNEAESNQILRKKLEEIQTELDNSRASTQERNSDNEAMESSSKLDSEESKTDDIKLEFKNLKEKFSSLEAENHSLTLKIQALERERLDHEEVVSKLKDSLNKLNVDYLAASVKLKDMEELKVALQREKELLISTKSEVARITELNSELSAEMESCRHKEGELLEFTERLTAKSVLLQSEHNALEEKCSVLSDETNRLRRLSEEFEREKTELQELVNKERESHKFELTQMARKIAEKNELVNKFKVKKDELENEIKVMKKKHFNSLRELNKELLSMKKHMEICESHNSKVESSQANSETASNCSQGSSSSPHAPGSNSSNNIANGQQAENLAMPPPSEVDIIPNVDKQMLINKIFRLQKAIAKKQEKIDFLEEHNHQLLQEMKKKTKLIQHYIMREEAGALTTNKMDENKVNFFLFPNAVV